MWIGGRTVEELYQSTMQRIDDLKNVFGYEVHVKWECEFREELKRDPELKAEYDEIFIPSALDHRAHTLRGGRTEPLCLRLFAQQVEDILPQVHGGIDPP